MSYDIEEQEHLDNLKVWWATYGKLIINIITAFLIAVSAFFSYKWWRQNQEYKAYNLVNQLNAAIEAKQNKEVLKLANQLKQDYPNSTHAAVGIIRTGEILQDDKNANLEVINLLRFVANNEKQEQYAILANYRLASILINNKNYDEAISLMNKPVNNNIWQGLYADRTADAYAAKGDIQKAKTFYEKALKIAKDSKNHGLENFISL